MKKKVKLLIITTVVVMSFTQPQFVSAQNQPVQQNKIQQIQKENEAQRAQILQKEKAIQLKNEQIRRQNLFIKSVNKELLLLQKQYKNIVKSYKNNTKKINSSKDLKPEDKNNLIKKLNIAESKYTKNVQKTDKLLRKLKNPQELANFKATKLYKDTINNIQIFNPTIKEYDALVQNKQNQGKVTLYSYLFVGIVALIALFVYALNSVIKNTKKRRIKRYFEQLTWQHLIDGKKIKINHDVYFEQECNVWIEKKVKKLFSNVDNVEFFKQNNAVFKYLKSTKMLTKATLLLFERYCVSFVNFQQITTKSNFTQNLKELLENNEIELSTFEYERLVTSSERLEKNLIKNKLIFNNLTWNTRVNFDGNMKLNPNATFEFQKDNLTIVTDSIELEVGYDKLYLRQTQQIAFKDQNNEYYININQEQKMLIQNYIYRNYNKVLWTGESNELV